MELADLVVVNNARSKITLLYNQTGKTNLIAAAKPPTATGSYGVAADGTPLTAPDAQQAHRAMDRKAADARAVVVERLKRLVAMASPATSSSS